MSFYRFEAGGIGIYEAVDRDCPKDDIRRDEKPDGGWLPKVGSSYPGAISFWTENGLRKYIASGLFNWHRTVARAPVMVRIADVSTTAVYEDDLQRIVDKNVSLQTTVKHLCEFITEKSWDWLKQPEDRNDTTIALQALAQEIEHATNKAKALFELAGAYDFLGEEETALEYYEQVRRIGIGALPDADQSRFYVQFGSTLRNCWKLDESREVLREGIRQFPEVLALKGFLGLTEYTAGNYKDAARYLASALSRQEQDVSMKEYARALRYYIDHLDLVPFKIRQATNADTPQIKELIFSVLEEYGLKADPAITDADLNDIENSYLRSGGMFDVVESASGMLVGTVGLFPLKSSVCELRKMYLAKSCRGLGLGRKLLDRILGQAKQMGFKQVELETASVLKEAINLYERYGFRELARSQMASRCDQAYVLDLQ